MLIFTGSVLFSDAQPEQKFYYLFDLFDFNEFGTLSFFDLIHLLDTCLFSVLRMFKIPEKRISINEEDINNLLEKYLFPVKRVSKLEFKRIISSDPLINRFLEIIEIENFKQEKGQYINEKVFSIKKDEYFKMQYDLLYTEESRKNNFFYSK